MLVTMLLFVGEITLLYEEPRKKLLLLWKLVGLEDGIFIFSYSLYNWAGLTVIETAEPSWRSVKLDVTF